MYKCANCGKLIEPQAEEPTRCQFCGHKVLFKERPKVVKRVKVR